MKGLKIPKVTFRVRQGDTVLEQGCSFEEGKWVDQSTDDYFKGKRVVLFSLPGAFTPTCTSTQLPGFEENYDKIKGMGIDEVYCCSVNDTFVMNAWAEVLKIKNVKVIPDGSGNFTRFMGMLIGKNHLGFGMRSWRYMAVINDGVVEAWWQEPGINNDGSDADPYVESTPENMMAYLEQNKQMRVPYTNFKTRKGDEWQEVDTVDIFDNKTIVVFAVPGAFTLTRSLKQLLDYEKNHDDIKALGVDDVYCLSVNDTLVMNAWFKDVRISKVKPIGDGEGVFTHGMGMLVNTPKQGFGMRSWRYSMLVDNGEVVKIFEEPGKNNYDDSPLEISDANTMVKYLKGLNAG